MVRSFLWSEIFIGTGIVEQCSGMVSYQVLKKLLFVYKSNIITSCLNKNDFDFCKKDIPGQKVNSFQSLTSCIYIKELVF